MGQLWTNAMEERWRAIQEEAANPKDFLIAHHINMNDRLRGLARYVVAAIRYRTVGGVEPFLSLRQQIETANIDRQIGPERQAEAAAWLKETATEEDPFEGLFFDDD